MSRTRDFTVDVVEPLPPVDGNPARYTLLTKETVVMTVLAQDPSVVDGGGPVRAGLAVPAERLQRGPRGHRFHVVDLHRLHVGPYHPTALLGEGQADLAPDALRRARDERDPAFEPVQLHALILPSTVNTGRGGRRSTTSRRMTICSVSTPISTRPRAVW